MNHAHVGVGGGDSVRIGHGSAGVGKSGDAGGFFEIGCPSGEQNRFACNLCQQRIGQIHAGEVIEEQEEEQKYRQNQRCFDKGDPTVSRMLCGFHRGA